MTVESHISVLRRRHDELDEQIAAALQHRGIDDLEIQAMKKEKLQLKDEITRLEAAVE
ncbi:YdcH family protein [Cereibacter sphaeroides]|uniref:YdcH family protein n=1 Tax=Cereibacter sphaeroides TaxID=1063 RepID=UPI001F22F8A8|nr:YdcH family protein [Cereibacter sphaeroides]MCE6951413.1 YdcH family protein [Cereibacter sphaeroides]